MGPQRNPPIYWGRMAGLGRTANPGKHTVRGLLGVLIALFACVTSGCLFPSGYDRRLFLQDGIELFGTPFQGQDSKPISFQYRLLTIQYQDTDKQELNKLGILFDNGDIVPLGDINIDVLARRCESWYQQQEGTGGHNPEDWRKVNPNEINYYEGKYHVHLVYTEHSKYSFVVHDGQIIEFQTGSDPYFSSRPPAVLYSMPECKEYRFPLTQEQAIELFGEPYKIEDYKVYYPDGL